MKCFALLALLAAPGVVPAAAVTVADPAQDKARTEQYATWIAQMKRQPRGPFSAIRWYCQDGTVLEPQAGNCAAHGGGVQHGEWNASARELRAQGYLVGSLLVEIDPEKIAGLGAPPEMLQQVLLERFLVGYDDGWIFRGARSYRGAIQHDDEWEAGKRLLLRIVERESSFLRRREAVRLLPHAVETPTLRRVRELSASLQQRDPRFAALRARIHNAPEAADAGRVRAHAAAVAADADAADADLAGAYAELATTIDAAFRPAPLHEVLTRTAQAQREPLLKAGLLEQAQRARAAGVDPAAQLRAAAQASAWLREHAPQFDTPERSLAALDASLAAESAAIIAGSKLAAQLAPMSRAARLAWLETAGIAAYGAGLLSARELGALQGAIAGMPSSLPLADYRAKLEYLARIPGWGNRRVEGAVADGLARLAPVEPAALLYAADRVRGSPLLFYSRVLQSLRDDADGLAGMRHRMFGAPVRGQLRRLNPGLARGVLRTSTNATSGGAAIFLVPATVAQLPPAAGILTEDEGNPLSHVQLLARNLGIPNVVVARELVPALAAHANRRVVVAASSGGQVQIAADSAEWDDIFGRGGAHDTRIYAEPAKLELWRTELLPTSVLRASASGRVVGPKAAQVGELEHRFAQQVSPGLAIPFGVYRELLQRPVRRGGPPMFEWMKLQYEAMAVQLMLDPEQHARRLAGFLAFTRKWIETQPLDIDLRERLYHALHDRFGMRGTWGVFVRSDTNVEDLPGFTGAGLNLTVPNVVDFDGIVTAVRQVWASPFSERAFGWRQGLMDQPEHVYVSVLLHRTVPAEKSGVMVTADVDSGDARVLTVTTSPGAGGGVDGEASETLRIDARTGAAELLASALARRMRTLPPGGGAALVRIEPPELVLQPAEIAQLVAFARDLPERFPELKDGDGELAPADVEFAFVHGQLRLLQIRPFLQSRAAAQQRYLVELDEGLARAGRRHVDLREPPAERAS